MGVRAITSAVLCLLPLVLSYPLIKERHNDTRTHLKSAPEPPHNGSGTADRCTDEGFGAITLDDDGVIHYFRGDSVWTGFQGPPQSINESWSGLTGPIDAAFRNHNGKKPQEHQRTYLFKGSLVWSYFGGELVTGYPRLISQEFPGVPDHLDAAVECHQGDCRTDSIVFFKGDWVYIYSAEEQPPVKQRRWVALGSCTAAVRWMDRYYCFNGVSFTRFHPVSGQVLSPRPLDTRDYFLSCPGRGHKHTVRQNASLASIINRCSNRSFEAFSSDDNSRTYAFRGGWFFRLDSSKDGWHPWPLNHTWSNLQGAVDAAFTVAGRMYFIQGSQVSIYLSDQIYIPVAGYPKAIDEEWDVSGMTAVDAAFTCPHSSDLYLIMGNKLTLVDLITRKRSGEDRIIIHTDLDSAMCNTHGLYLLQGPIFYHYKNVEELLSSREAPTPGNIASYFMDC
ncbi:hemopexin [Phyllobates terribilis]|uniref:hemopexin n=1 Tax=Phyllobates terribilis TaxID=111132 RepID=UPI003CCB6EEF